MQRGRQTTASTLNTQVTHGALVQKFTSFYEKLKIAAVEHDKRREWEKEGRS